MASLVGFVTRRSGFVAHQWRRSSLVGFFRFFNSKSRSGFVTRRYEEKKKIYEKSHQAQPSSSPDNLTIYSHGFGFVFWESNKAEGVKGKWEVKKMVGNEGEAGSLRPSAQEWVPQKVEKIEWWEAKKYVPNGWGIENWCILYDEWWVSNDKNWVRSDE